MYTIRLEGIGGYGANLTGKILGTIAFEYLDKYTRAFSSYGSEKRGSPVKSYIYMSDTPILVNTPIIKPDILCIFSLNLAGKENLTVGVDKNTKVIVNTDKSVEEVVDILKLPNCKLYTIDATNCALECHSRVNMVLLGAIARASEFISVDNCIAVVKSTLIANGNINAIKIGYNNVSIENIESKYKCVEYREISNNTTFGGVLKSVGSTITNNLSGCREGKIPKFIVDKCINCGLCESTCPDMVFQFRDGVNLGLDLKHCKGCMRCVEICPTNALIEVKEGEYTKDISNIYLKNTNFDLDNIGYSSLIEGDVYDAKGSTDKHI